MAGFAVIDDIFDGSAKCYPGFEIDYERCDEKRTMFVRANDNPNDDETRHLINEVSFPNENVLIVSIGKGWYGIVMRQDIVDLFPEEEDLYERENEND